MKKQKKISPSKKESIFKRIISQIKSFFLHGLFTILPIVVTVFIISFTYTIVSQWLEPLRKIQPQFLQKIPASEFIVVTIFIMALGLLLKLFFITPIVHWFEGLITKIPFIRTVYSSSKTLVDFFNVPSKQYKTKKVVLIQFPKKGIFNIAFLLEPATDNFQKLIPEEMQEKDTIYYKIFMPNSPNPTTGYFFILPETEIIQTDMTFDEAIKAIVSCGLITPKSLKK